MSNGSFFKKKTAQRGTYMEKLMLEFSSTTHFACCTMSALFALPTVLLGISTA